MLRISDSASGIVYQLQEQTGKIVKVIKDPLMKPDSPSFGIGINGIQIEQTQLDFTSNNRDIFARIGTHQGGRYLHNLRRSSRSY